MTIATAYKKMRAIVWPLLFLWLFCQSMILCAGIIQNFVTPETVTVQVDHSHMDHGLMDHSHHAHGYMSASVDSANHHTSSQMDCCEEQGTYIPQLPYSSILATLAVFTLFWFFNLSRPEKMRSYLLEAPPPRFNFPRQHIVHCSYLN